MTWISILPAVLLAFLCFSPDSSVAAPIPDGVFMPSKSGWFPSNQTPCPEVCKKQNARAEFDRFDIPNPDPNIRGRLTFVCKAKADTPNEGAFKGSGILFGNNFQSRFRRNVCIVSTPQVRAQRKTEFMCLCVIPMRP